MLYFKTLDDKWFLGGSISGPTNTCKWTHVDTKQEVNFTKYSFDCLVHTSCKGFTFIDKNQRSIITTN